MADENVRLLGELLARSIDQASHIGEVVFSGDAEILYRELYPELSGDRDRGAWSTVTARAEVQVIRLALCYALIDGLDVIDLKHLRAAVAAWQYCDDSARYLFEKVSTAPLVDRVIDHLKAGSKTTTQLHKAFSGHVDSRSLNTTLSELVDDGRVVRSGQATGGRSSKICALAPGINEEKAD